MKPIVLSQKLLDMINTVNNKFTYTEIEEYTIDADKEEIIIKFNEILLHDELPQCIYTGDKVVYKTPKLGWFDYNVTISPDGARVHNSDSDVMAKVINVANVNEALKFFDGKGYTFEIEDDCILMTVYNSTDFDNIYNWTFNRHNRF